MNLVRVWIFLFFFVAFLLIFYFLVVLLSVCYGRTYVVCAFKEMCVFGNFFGGIFERVGAGCGPFCFFLW